MKRWAAKNKVELCITPTYASWANPIEPHFGPLRQFTLANSNHPNHTVHPRALHAYLRWRNQNSRHPDVLAAQRRERARIRNEKGFRWGGRPTTIPTLAYSRTGRLADVYSAAMSNTLAQRGHSALPKR